jgi:hypothetical protein
MNGFAASCRSKGEDDGVNLNFVSLALLGSSDHYADAHQRACFCPGDPVVKGSGHCLMEEATGQIIPAIVAFLK